MNRSTEYERNGGDEENTLLVVNPREEVIGDKSDLVRMAGENYSGEVYRLDNMERMEDAPGFYDNQEDLMNQLHDIAEEGKHLDPFWYDDAFIFDNAGLDSTDQAEITQESSSLEFLGGPLEDIAAVISSIEAGTKEASYILNKSLAFDYGAWSPDHGYVEEELNSLGDILEADEPGMNERLRHHRLDRENIHF